MERAHIDFELESGSDAMTARGGGGATDTKTTSILLSLGLQIGKGREQTEQGRVEVIINGCKKTYLEFLLG